MKYVLVIIVLAFTFGCPDTALAAEKEIQCRECHTKNPKLYRMHEAVGFKDCMMCHKPGSFKFGQSLGQNTPTPEQRNRMATDPVCKRCHTAG